MGGLIKLKWIECQLVRIYLYVFTVGVSSSDLLQNLIKQSSFPFMARPPSPPPLPSGNSGVIFFCGLLSCIARLLAQFIPSWDEIKPSLKRGRCKMTGIVFRIQWRYNIPLCLFGLKIGLELHSRAMSLFLHQVQMSFNPI